MNKMETHLVGMKVILLGKYLVSMLVQRMEKERDSKKEGLLVHLKEQLTMMVSW